MSILVEAKQLYRYYGKYCAVHDLSFNLAKGQVLGFLGVNGAGKTTTMQMLAGNLAPSNGEILINGIDLLKQPQAAKLNLGYLPDTPPLYKELSVNEFLQYCAQLHRLPNTQILKAVNLVLERCGLTEVANRLIGNLSKGYQQRVGIAQALVHNPSVIILDEPTVGLDPLQIKEIRALIKQLGQDHGIILSTHILPEVQESCTDVQIIHQGKLVLHETISALNQRMTSAKLKVITRLVINMDVLKNIVGVYSVVEQEPQHYLIEYNQPYSPLEPITETIIAQGWGLQEITPLKQTLEDVFVALTAETTLKPETV